MKSVFLFMSFVVAGIAFVFWIADVIPPFGQIGRKEMIALTPGRSAQVIRGVGYVEPDSEIRKLTFKVDGVIESCSLKVGQAAKAGDILATLRNHDEKAAVVVAAQELNLAKADRDKLLSGVHPAKIEAAQRRVARLKDRLRYCQQVYDREAGLQEQKASTKEQFDLATTEFYQAQEELKEAHAELVHLQTFVRREDQLLAAARVQLAEANLAAAKERFEDTILKAPMSGTVLEIIKREGEAAKSFDPMPVLIFADLSHLRVRAEIDERYVNDVRVGQDAKIYGRGLGNQRLSGKVVLVKTLMGNKTVFSRESSERKDLEVLQVFIQPDRTLGVPVGLKIDVELTLDSPGPVAKTP